MLSFKNDSTIKDALVKRMDIDEMCAYAVSNRIVLVDAEKGKVIATRSSAGKEVGGKNARGYRVLSLWVNGRKKQVYVHRLIWISVNGIPKKGLQIDHINRVKDDNRIVNLRLVTPKINSSNRVLPLPEERANVKATREIAKNIRSEYLPRIVTIAQLADKYHLSKSLVQKIILNKKWVSSL